MTFVLVFLGALDPLLDDNSRYLLIESGEGCRPLLVGVLDLEKQGIELILVRPQVLVDVVEVVLRCAAPKIIEPEL